MNPLEIEHIKKELDAFKELIKASIRTVMDSDMGVNDKINRNTLSDSQLYANLEFDVDGTVAYELVQQYLQYIESGMKEGHWVKAEYLLPWMQRRGIPTDNDTLARIQGSIYWYGISPRPIWGTAMEVLDAYWDGWSDMLFNAIIKEFDEYMNS